MGPKKRGPKVGTTKLTKGIQDAIVNAIQMGNYIETAAAVSGVSKNTLYEWLRTGKRAEELSLRTGEPIPDVDKPFAKFSDAVNRAQAQSELLAVAIITRAAQTQWQAAAWRLERQHSDRWGKKDHLDANVTNTGKISVIRIREQNREKIVDTTITEE